MGNGEEGGLTGEVEDQHYSLAPVEVRCHHRSIAFLSSSIPDVQLNRSACDLHLPDLEVDNGDCLWFMFQKLTFQILPEERGLADSALSDHDDFELRFVALGEVLFLQHRIIHALSFPPYHYTDIHQITPQGC